MQSAPYLNRQQLLPPSYIHSHHTTKVITYSYITSHNKLLYSHIYLRSTSLPCQSLAVPTETLGKLHVNRLGLKPLFSVQSTSIYCSHCHVQWLQYEDVDSVRKLSENSLLLVALHHISTSSYYHFILLKCMQFQLQVV